MRILLRLHLLLIGLSVATAGTLLAIEACWVLARPSSVPLLVPWPGWKDRLAGFSWSRIPVLGWAGALVLLGVLLLAAAGCARRHDVQMTDPAEEVTVVTSPRSLARLVGHRVREQDGVRSASVSASARRVRVRATSTVRSADQLRPALLRTVNALVNDLPLLRQPRVQVVVNSVKNRR